MADYTQLMNLEKKAKTPSSPLRNDALPHAEPQRTDVLANQQTHKPANPQTSKEANIHTSLPADHLASKEANQQTSKTLKKFGSYLTEESIKHLKRIAFETDRKDYEVLQEAVDAYLQRVKA